MKNKKPTIIIAVVLGIALILILIMAVLIATHTICIFHEMQEATCTIAETCRYCGHTEGEPQGHNWMQATCTQPKTCSVCLVTEGTKMGHSAGKEYTAYENIVDGYKVIEQACKRCGEILIDREETYTTLISNGTLICTPAQYMDRIENAFDIISDCYLTAGTRNIDGRLYGLIWDTSGDAVMSLTFVGTGDSLITNANSHGVRGFLGRCYDDDSIAPIMIGLILAGDPKLSFYESKQIAMQAYEGYKTDDYYEYNGLRYLLTRYDGSWLFGIVVPND